ncbi:MAG: protein-disulfide reductase DsbD family protein [Chitinophagaceae bacterium]
MYHFRHLIPLFLIFFWSPFFSYSQESEKKLEGWTASSNKVGEKEYTIVFELTDSKGWQVYAPVQPTADLVLAEIQWEDSSLAPTMLENDGSPSEISSDLFGSTVRVYEQKARFKTNIKFADIVPGKIRGKLLYNFGKGLEFYNAVFQFTLTLEGGAAAESRIRIASIDIDNPTVDCGDVIDKDNSYLTIFLLGFLGGLIALLTPCVFPMIPLTVSFFTGKNGQSGKGVGSAILYGFFIFLIFVLLTIPFHVVGGTNPAIFNNISTNVWLNLIFFAIFVVFALSFFGLFEITLPSAIANRADSRSGLGNVAGIFFMALTLAIVSFSCTGPILGTLLVGVLDGGAWPLTIGAGGFGLALGLPFALFALFPKVLARMPKSGGWMTDVKVVLGFVELALAVKFLANADNVQQWGILKREVFIAAWIIIGLLATLYLLGVIRVGHSTRPKKFGPVRWLFILLFGGFTLYLIPGLTNTKWAKLSLISGFPPPTCYSIYSHPVNCDKPLLDYELALAEAKRLNKPILIDFTGWACVNCRRMEENVWTDPEVERLMKEEFVLVSLYVDERRPLPASEKQVYTMKNGTEKSIQTVGDKWTAFQLENFNATAQPQYAIVSPDEKALTKTKFYTLDPKEFAEWLKCGLEVGRGER